ncbi:MAG TPA: cation:proton antiporter [Thermoanaerobaculia bacterium]|nr:cation:proton antiporter [Thermoanaerobaculia bacterium]
METPSFLAPLVLVFVAALAAAYGLARLRQPPLLGYLLAGALLGPYGLRLARDVHQVEALAEVGVVLLLFTVGLEFSLSDLGKLGRFVWGAGPIQVAGTFLTTAAVLVIIGRGPAQAAFAGFLAALSSTAIVLNILIDRGEIDSPHGRFLVGMLVFQDMAVVPMMLLIPTLVGHGGGLGPATLALAKTAAMAAGVVFASRVVVPRFLSAIVATRRKELFVVAVLVIVLGTALATSAAGLSLALGAFLAGVVLSETEYGTQTMAEIAPFRDAFNALFFVAVGMLFDARTLTQRPALVAVVLLALFALKVFWGGLPVLFYGFGIRVATAVGVSLAQVGEFSFVLVRQGRAAGLISEDGYQIFLAVALLSMLATPLLSEAGHHFGLTLADRLSELPRRSRRGDLPAEGHVLVLGFGLTGETLARVLGRAKVPFRVLDLNPDRVWRGKAKDVPIEYGDVTNDRVLKHAGIERATAVLVLLSDPRATRRAVSRCRKHAPGAFLLARTRYLTEIPQLSALGADEVVAEEFETSLEIANRTLRRLGFPVPWVEAEAEEIRQRRHEAFGRFRKKED